MSQCSLTILVLEHLGLVMLASLAVLVQPTAREGDSLTGLASLHAYPWSCGRQVSAITRCLR